LTTDRATSAGEGELEHTVRDTFGTTADGQTIDRYTLTNANGSMARIITLGATVTELHVRDRQGELADVVLGFDTAADYEANTPYMGCVVGRVANRISDARFTLDGKVYEVAKNFGDNHIHGGVVGFHQRVWSAESVKRVDGTAVRFSYVSPDGEENYPGNLSVSVVYTLTADDALRLEYEATTDKPTPLNLTNHSYFNLAGSGSGSILDHVLTIHTNLVTERGEEGVPTGQILFVEGTPLDFRKPKRIGDQIAELEVGYDDNFVFGSDSRAAPIVAAEAYDPRSGRVMEVSTTEPGVQLYSGWHLDGPVGKDGAVYDQFAGLCFETQHFPDGVNKPHFPNTILRPGETYRQTTRYRFSTR
jgi:aldose 1-epimerase